jgi:hypothetical protein
VNLLPAAEAIPSKAGLEVFDQKRGRPQISGIETLGKPAVY